MKQRITALFLALLLLAALSLSGCSQRPQESADGRLRVVCSLFPYYDFVRQIGGEDVDVSLLVPAGRETHSFEPTPLDVIRVSEADVFVYNGGESEVWVENILGAAGEKIPHVLRMMDYADALEEEFTEGMQQSGHDHDHDEDDSDEISYDEHIWTSPVQAQTLCRAIADTLCAADPAHAADYQARLTQYLAQLQALDASFREVAANGQRNLLVFGDRFPLLYFCRTYGLNYRAAFHGCAGDTEPSLATLKYLIDRVESEQIPVVYTIELSSQKIADAIAETTGAQVRTFYSCQTVSRADFDRGETYLSLMQKNVEALKEGLLACRDVSLGYEGRAVWEHLNLEIRSGEYLCIVGENGSGKSTLLKSLLGLIKPLRGSIELDPSLRSGAIGYLPQQTRAQKDFPATVSEVVLSGFLSARGRRFFYTPAEKSRALMNLGKLGILELKDRCYRELSGGQQQRVLLARALCAAGELLILDEPVTGLDPAAAQDLYRTLAYLNKTEGIAIVMVTHDIRSALRYATRILHAGQGQWFSGSVAEYLASPYGKRFGGETA